MRKISYLSFTLLFILSISFTSFANNSKEILGEFSSIANIAAAQNDGRTNSYQAEKNRAIAAFAEAEKSGNLTDELTANNLTELPVGLLENRNSIEYGLVVTKVKFTPEYALIDVYARIVTPQQGVANGKQELYFGAQELKLSYSGGLIGEAKLSMIGDVYIPFNKNEWMLTIEGGMISKQTGGNSYNENTFVIIDCDGIKELSLKGNVQLSRNLVVPIDRQGKIDERETIMVNGKSVTNRVRGDFQVKSSDWNDLIVEVNLSPFAITAQTQNENKGYFSFLINKAILDLSDLRNAPGMIFPKKYQENGYLPANEESWRGLFIQNLAVQLPEEFKSSKSDRLLSFDAQNMILDTYGVSGFFSANNVLPLTEGVTDKESGWAYSVDRIGIELAASKIVGGNLEGQIVLPMQSVQAKENAVKSGLAYQGIITEDDYLLSVEMATQLDFNIWSATAGIAPGSSVELQVKNRKFLPKAILNGSMNIAANVSSEASSADNKNKQLQLNDIEFEGLTFQTVAPYVTVSSFGYTGNHTLANFPINIDEIVLVADRNKTELGIGVTVGLQDKGFSASGAVFIEGAMTSVDARQSWEYKGFRVSKLALNKVDIKVATISGELEIMTGDTYYGDGFRGFLAAEVLDKVNVKVNAYFGYNKFRYWGFEGSADGFTMPTPLGVDITGFTGGAFYRMKPDPARSGKGERALVFVPNEKVGLALRAGVYGSLKKKGIVDFMASFNISTNANGGLANVGFLGEAYIMADLASKVPNPFAKLQEKFQQVIKIEDKNLLNEIENHKRLKPFLDVSKVEEYYPIEQVPNSDIYGKLAMNYDFGNKLFHADLDVLVNTPGNFITGLGNNGRAGWAVMHLASDEWYLHIGTPTDMIGLKVGIGKFSVRSGSYFMVGTNIPASPKPPVEIANMLGVQLQDIDYMRHLNTLGNGRGFAFGTHFKFDTGDMTALILYANFKAGIGADIMLKNYGEAACSNRGGDKIGINGWYANGQAYAYLQGVLGVKVKLFALKKKIPIIKAGAGTLLQLKGPNPYWMRGYLAGNYSLLGGLVKGRYRFKLEFGEECQLAEQQQGALGGMKIISDLTPRNNEQDVNVFSMPQATFALKINEPMSIQEDDGEHTYKVVIDKFVILDENNTEIAGRYELDKTGDVANFISSEILPPSKKLKAIVEVSFLEKKNGIYQVVLENGKKATEREERYFVTGTAPTNIPLENIQYAYPVIEQKNFYSKETNRGFIRLKQGQNYLFEDKKWKTLTRFIADDGKTIETDFNYNATNNEVSFVLPELEKEKYYTFTIVAKPVKSTNTTANPENTNQQISQFDEDKEQGITMHTQNKTAQSLYKDGNIERLSFTFRTSKYNTLAEKVEKINFTTLKGRISSDLVYLKNEMNADEAFDKVELVGSRYTDNKPLIVAEALMDDYFAEKIKSWIYDEYPLEGIRLLRDTPNNAEGIPPVRALPLATAYLNYLEREIYNVSLKQIFPYKYDLFRFYKSDWYETVARAAELKIYNKTTLPKIDEILNSSFGIIPDGKYKIDMKYLLPDGTAGSSKKVIYDMKSNYL